MQIGRPTDFSAIAIVVFFYLLHFCAFVSLQEKCTTLLSIVPVVGILHVLVLDLAS